MQITTRLTALLLAGALHSSYVIADHSSTSMLTDTCVACHGEEGNSVGPAIPNLAGMSPNYLMGAMLAYKYDDDDDKLDSVIESDADFEDVEAFPRYSTIMGRLAKGYTEEEIKQIAEHFSNESPIRASQSFDSANASAGKKLHDKYCEKCHEDEGRLADDDTGVLAGQWKSYFLYSMKDFANGDRAMPKKMKNKLEEMAETDGEEAIEKLADYYSSITD
ncbi:MAG: c-type cytochrome [Gammaproteobacteria bacterium]|nr:c-type cytochrome [Gammaproteobacteria bacterium]